MLRYCPVIVASFLLASTVATSAPLEHPTLFFNSSDVPQMRERSQSTSWLRARRERLVQEADALLATPTDLVEYVSQNLGDRHRRRFTGRLAKARIETPAQAGYLTGDERYLRKARDILLAVVRQFEPTDRSVWWNHLQYLGATQTIVIAYDLLYPSLTAAERIEVREEIRKYGTLLYTDDSTWGAEATGVTSSNHNPVHYGALALAALVLGDEPQWLAHAIERMEGYYNLFADETGYVTEGHGYLGYGQSAAVPFSIALRRLRGVDLIKAHPVLQIINDQFVWMLLPFGGNIRTLNDSQNNVGSPRRYSTPSMRATGVQLWAWLQASAREFLATGHMNGLEEFGDLLLLTSSLPPAAPLSPGKAGWRPGRRAISDAVPQTDDAKINQTVLNLGTLARIRN